jgi:hypothetical protein
MKHLKTKPSYYAVILMAIFISAISTSCRKKTLDLESEVHTIKELLKSTNCDTDCGAAADCEGKEVQVEGILDENNINADQSQFFMYDQKDNDYQIAITVNTDIKDAVFEKLTNKGGKLIEVRGIITGYDAHTNFSCERKFGIELANLDDVVIK